MSLAWVWIATTSLSCIVRPLSSRRFWKQQQIRGPQQLGSERVLRRRGKRLSEPAVLRPHALLQHPRPWQLWTGGDHRHQAAQVHVMLLPLLSPRGGWDRRYPGSYSGPDVVFLHHIHHCLHSVPSGFHTLFRSLAQLEVQSPPGNTVGYVKQQWHPFSPKFIVSNEHSEPVLKINGPFCGWSCLPDVDFEVGLSKHRKPLHLWKQDTVTFWPSGHFLFCLFFARDPPRAPKQEICFQSERAVSWMKLSHGARSRVAQCGHCCTAQLVLLDWAVKGIWVSDTDLLLDPEEGNWSMILPYRFFAAALKSSPG